MSDLLPLSPNLVLAFTTYLLGAGSPGPSNLAIMGVAMRDGVRPALALATGVFCGALTWALLAAFGMSATLAAWPGALVALKIAGGLYLMWLGYKAARSALRSSTAAEPSAPSSAGAYRVLFLKGAAMHLTNPKAIFVWLSIVSMALPAGAAPRDALPVVAVCIMIGACIFSSYALVFSTSWARNVYRKIRRGFEGTLAVMFALTGLRMILTSGVSM